jgi:hypothetical protein
MMGLSGSNRARFSGPEAIRRQGWGRLLAIANPLIPWSAVPRRSNFGLLVGLRSTSELSTNADRHRPDITEIGTHSKHPLPFVLGIEQLRRESTQND